MPKTEESDEERELDPIHMLMNAMGAAWVTEEAEKRMQMRPTPADLDLTCPYCDGENLEYDGGIRTDYNITISHCNDCSGEWCKDQTVKIPGVYVRRIVSSIRQHENYTGLSDFVRDAIRMKCDDVLHSEEAAENRDFEKLASLALLALPAIMRGDDDDDDVIDQLI